MREHSYLNHRKIIPSKICFLKKDFIYLFIYLFIIFREKGREEGKRGREIAI